MQLDKLAPSGKTAI